MTDEVKIRSVENGWIIRWAPHISAKEEIYASFDVAIERMRQILDVEFIESQF